MPEELPLPDGAKKTIPRILIIDHHDSYTLNLLISISEATHISSKDLFSRVVVLPHNHPLLATAEAFIGSLLPHFDALILGPGPGHPKKESDFGPAGRILRSILNEDIAIPTLGVCLGHQGIAHVCGAQVIEGDSLRHGQVSEVEVAAMKPDVLAWPSLFDNNDQVKIQTSKLSMVRYNSLTVDETTLPEELIVTAWSKDSNWATPPPQRNSYSPALDLVETTLPVAAQGRVVMALQHRALPLWGVQFHPESIASQNGHLILKNFIENCTMFKSGHHASGKLVSEGMRSRSKGVTFTSAPLPAWIRDLGRPLISAFPSLRPLSSHNIDQCFKVVSIRLARQFRQRSNTCAIFETAFAGHKGAKIWLDSSRSGDPQNQFSYMAIPSWQIHYTREERKVHLSGNDRSYPLTSFDLDVDDQRVSSIDEVHGLVTPKASRSNSPEMLREVSRPDFWSWIERIQESFQNSTVKNNCSGAPPFQTGFVGYFDYEMKGESLTRGKEILKERSTTAGGSVARQGLPSASFGFCDRLLAYDHEADEWWATYLVRSSENAMQGDEASLLMKVLKGSGISVGMSSQASSEWLAMMQDKIDEASKYPFEEQEMKLPPLVPRDAALTYKDKIEAARAYIRKGESYEICVTTQFEGQLHDTYKGDSFELYKSLRRKNPAPFSAYLDLGNGQSVSSTSPERFMSIDVDGRVEMRPIKGTLARAGYKTGEEGRRMAKESGDQESIAWCKMEDEKRRAALTCDPKERAENLMIVDLIRADLLSFCPPKSVQVPALMQVESYESVHQLVTTIIGQKDQSVSSIEALKRSFPPGSMTGAPKVRSVDILERLEQRNRGVYSGILGWIGVDGAAATSVIIRTVVVDGHNVSVGAGGAITYLSEAEQEWQEVLDKVKAIGTIE